MCTFWKEILIGNSISLMDNSDRSKLLLKQKQNIPHPNNQNKYEIDTMKKVNLYIYDISKGMARQLSLPLIGKC